MFSQLFSRSTAICRNDFGYRPTLRFFATRSPFSCKVCQLCECLIWRVQSTLGRRRLFLSCLPADQEPHNLRLSPSLLVGDRLSVRVQRHPRGGMAKQFLHFLDISARGAQQGRIRVAERMPSQSTTEPEVDREGADDLPHDRLSPIWQASTRIHIGSQNNGNLLTFCALPHESNGIRVADSVADPMIEQHAHQVPKLGTACPRKGEGPQPKLHLSGFKRFGRVFIPAWNDPFPLVAFIAVSCREGAPGELSF